METNMSQKQMFTMKIKEKYWSRNFLEKIKMVKPFMMARRMPKTGAEMMYATWEASVIIALSYYWTLKTEKEKEKLGETGVAKYVDVF